MTRRKKRFRLSPFKAGALAIVLIALFSYGAYTKFANPFANPYTIHALFANANGLRPDSLVRIAGVNVGEVKSIAPAAGCKNASVDPTQCQAADITMTIDPNGLPLHRDATFAIRPRIFLEGNFFVDVSPGSPEAPSAPDHYTFPIQQGIEPVQLDQVLGAFQSNTRKNLQTLLQQYGTAVKQGGPSFNNSIQYWTPAYQYSAEVAHDALGIQPHDLSNFIAQSGTVNGAIDAHPPNLESLVTNFNITADAFARQNVALQNAVQELPQTLAAAIPAFNALNAAFPPLREFARTLLPGVKSSGPAIDASLPFVAQLHGLVQPAELRGLVNDLSFTVPALAKLESETIPLMKNGVRPLSSCVANQIIPWSQLTVPDSHFNASNGFPAHPAYVEGVDYLPGLAGESRNFDANGPYIRVLGTGGELTYSLQPGLFGTALAPLTGVQPELPAPQQQPDHPTVPVSRPPLMENVPCETQQTITSLAAPTGTGPTQIHTVESPADKQAQGALDLAALMELKQQASQQGLGLSFGAAKKSSGAGK
jgi:phospholipid/cholesterol/gamma-HCH transport system substrate-binding protein